MLIHVLRVRFSDVSGISTTRHLVGVISAMVEKELGQRNFGFDSLKSRLKLDMEEKGLLPGIVSRRSPAAHGGASAMGSAGAAGNIYRQRTPPPQRRPWSPLCYTADIYNPLPVVEARAIIPFSSMWRFSLYYRLMWKWKNQRRQRTRPSRLRFIISSGGAHSFWL